MTDLEQKPQSGAHTDRGSESEPESKGPSLTLLYSLIAFALVAAMFLAGLIVLPFYRRR
jgi:hypothetical protein